MKRRLFWAGVIFILMALAILVADAFKKAHAAEAALAPDPWRILALAESKLNNPSPAKNLRARVERGAQLLTRGEGWEGEARNELTAAAADADVILAMLAPLIEKQNPPYPPPVLARAYHMRGYAMLLKFASTMRILKSGGTVEGRENRELSQDINDIIAVLTQAIDAYSSPESVRRFGLEWVKVMQSDIQKDLPALQQAQQQQQKRLQLTQQMGNPEERDMMKIILGSELGRQKPKDIRMIPAPPTDKRGGEKYSPGTKKLR